MKRPFVSSFPLASFLLGPKDDDSNTDDTKTGIDGSMDDSDSK